MDALVVAEMAEIWFSSFSSMFLRTSLNSDREVNDKVLLETSATIVEQRDQGQLLQQYGIVIVVIKELQEISVIIVALKSRNLRCLIHGIVLVDLPEL